MSMGAGSGGVQIWVEKGVGVKTVGGGSQVNNFERVSWVIGW